MATEKQKPSPSAKCDGQGTFTKQDGRDNSSGAGKTPEPPHFDPSRPSASVQGNSDLVSQAMSRNARKPPFGGSRDILDYSAKSPNGTAATDANNVVGNDGSSLTILFCLDANAFAAKRFKRDRGGNLVARKIKPGVYFRAVLVEHIANIAQLAQVISLILQYPKAFFVRSKPRLTANTERMRRLLHPKPDEPATLGEPAGGYYWFMVDIDSVDVGDIDPVAEPEKAFRYAIKHNLPEMFHGVAFFWQLSGSAGIKSGLRGHLFFWASRPVTCAELKALLRGCSVDLNVFSPVQPYFVAAPIFERGAVDPVSRRSGLCDCAPYVQLPDVIVITQAKSTTARKTGGGGVALGVEFGSGFENKLAQLGNGDGLSGFHAPLLGATSAYAYAHGAHFDRNSLRQRLRAAINAASKLPDREQDIARYTSDQYLDDIMQSAIEKFASPLVEPTYPAPALSAIDARTKIGVDVSRHLDDIARQPIELAQWHAAYDLRDKLLWAPLKLANALHRQSGRPGLFPRSEEENAEPLVDPLQLQSEIDTMKEQYAAAKAEIEKNFPGGTNVIDAAPPNPRNLSIVERTPMSPPVVAIVADVGLGKTTEWMSKVSGVPGAVMAGPRHNLGDELVKKLAAKGVDMAVYRGIAAEDPDAPGKTMCRDLPRAQAVIRAGLEISAKACGSSRVGSKCPFYDDCGYQKQRKKKPQLWYVPHNLLTLIKPSFIPKVTSLTTDETFYTVGLRGLEAKPEDCPSVAISDIAPSVDGNSFNELLRKGLEAMPDGYIPAEVIAAAGVTPSSCAIATHHNWKDKDGAERLKPGLSWAGAEILLRNAETNNKRVYALADFWRLTSLTLKQGGVSPYLRKVGDRIYMQWRRDFHRSWLTGPVLLLDATMPVKATREYFPRLGDVETIRVKTPFVRVRQITDNMMSMTALIANKQTSKKKNRERTANVERLSHYITVRAAGYRKVLVISYKGIEEQLRVPDNVMLAHFGAITGIDVWGDVDLLIVIGRIEPPSTAMENLARTVNARDVNRISPNENGEIRYPSIFRGIRLRRSDGCATVRNSEHPDPDVEELRWVTCEGGLLQAIGRARGVNRNQDTPLQVDVLTNVALPNVVDEAMIWKDIKPTRIEVAAAIATARALPLSDAELARCFPGLWRSPKAVETERAHEKVTSREDRIRAVWGGVPLLHATYRRTLGRGGQLSRAVISAGETDPRAALEGVTGKVLEFSLV